MKQTYDPNRDTKERILDAAERLFAEKGFQATSLRRITAEARANLAAVNYHFRSKESLIQAVLGRKIARINKQRIALLDQAEAASAGEAVPLDRIVHAFLAPLLLAEEDAVFVRLLARMYNEPGERIRQFLEPALRELIARFRPALERSLPGATRGTTAAAMMFTMGAALHFLAVGPMLDHVSQGAASHRERGFVLDCMVRYSAAGLRALGSTEQEAAR